MPIATLTFNLPEEEEDYKLANHAQEYWRVLEELGRFLRSVEKYGHDFKDADDAVEKIREKYYELLNEQGIEI